MRARYEGQFKTRVVTEIMRKAVIDIDITIEAADWPDEGALRRLIETALDTTFSHLGFDKVRGELSLVFTDDVRMRGINAKWRHINKPTNVLSFPAFDLKPGEEPKAMLGDIILAFETVATEAKETGKSFNHHLSHLIVHGLLHLLGYDHEDDQEAAVMERHEIAILRRLAIANPYL